MPYMIGSVPYQGEIPYANATGYDADAQAWFTTNEAAGGTITTAAKSLLSTAFSTTYNGLKYPDYKAKFGFLWIPLSDFAGIRTPIIGPTFTNVGLVSGDWNISSGLSCSNSKYLNTGVAVNSQTTANTCLFVGSPSVSNRFMIGAGSGGNFVDIAQYLTDAYTNNPATDGRIDGDITIAGNYFSNRSSNIYFEFVQNETIIGTKTGTNFGTASSVQPVYIGCLNNAGTPFGEAPTHPFDCASYGASLTTAERISFSRMLAAIRTGRASL
jgi:hypothetical protein